MTYDQIAEWVAENFDPKNYGTAKELWLEVGNRFVEDGMYLPPEAEEAISAMWESKVPQQEVAPPIQQDTLNEYLAPTAPQETLVQDDMIGIGPALQDTGVEAVPDVMKEAPAEQVQPQSQGGFFNTIGNFGRSVGKRFRSLFRF